MDAAYGDEVKVVRRGSRRSVFMVRILMRTTWDRLATRFSLLARIKKPHRRTPGAPKMLPGPGATPDTEPDSATGTDATGTEPPSAEDWSDSDRAKDAPTDDLPEPEDDTLARLGDQVRAAAKEDSPTPPPDDKPKNA